jgi:hypothetical protein
MTVSRNIFGSAAAMFIRWLWLVTAGRIATVDGRPAQPDQTEGGPTLSSATTPFPYPGGPAAPSVKRSWRKPRSVTQSLLPTQKSLIAPELPGAVSHAAPLDCRHGQSYGCRVSQWHLSAWTTCCTRLELVTIWVRTTAVSPRFQETGLTSANAGCRGRVDRANERRHYSSRGNKRNASRH